MPKSGDWLKGFWSRFLLWWGVRSSRNYLRWLSLKKKFKPQGYASWSAWLRWKGIYWQSRFRRLRDRLDLAFKMGPFRYLRVRREFLRAYRALYDRTYRTMTETHGQERVKQVHDQYGPLVRKGRLEAFFETGTEGMCWMVYEDGKKGYDGLVSIDQGDHLFIAYHDGTIAFEGEIDQDLKAGYQPYPMNPKYGQPCALGCWIHWTQRGWEPDDWARLFMWDMLKDSPDRVPLRAIVVKLSLFRPKQELVWPEDEEDEDGDAVLDDGPEEDGN